MKLAFVLGTRPEIIKLAPVIRECQSQNIPFVLIHSGQHYSPEMDTVFFRDLELPKPHYHLHIGKLEYRKRVGFAMRKLISIFEREWPDVVVVQGDTFTVLIGALAAKKLDRPVAHLEAGLRSHDLSMPEENNRIITDHLAEFLYPPTKDAEKNLREEGLSRGQAPVFGNTVVDALLQHAAISAKRSSLLQALKLKPKEYVLVTAHRQENVDNKNRLEGILEGIRLVKRANPTLAVVFPLHPRTEKMIKQFGLERPREIRFIEPVGYLDFLLLEQHARLILTDSGGIQEEASMFKVPCVTLRDNTERPETITAGMNVLAGADAKTIAAAAQTMLHARIKWKSVYGDGTAAAKIIAHLSRAVRERKTTGRLRWYARTVKRLFGGRPRSR
jgi:UDP-N-acetylglucosamine 2-epimerase (non-hydrolysing)